MRVRLLLLGWCAALVAGLAAPPAVAATGASTFAMIPERYDPSLRASQSYFIVRARPGQTFTNSVRVRNLGRVAGTALLYAVDATTGQTSGAVYLDRAKPRRGVGGWVTLGTRAVTLGPGESRLVPVTVRVPAGAKPGDHLGGIVAENEAITSSSGGGALQIRIRHLTIVAVEVQIPGKATARVDIGGVRAGGEHGYQYVYVHLKSTGALTTKPSGRLLVADASGRQVASRSFRLDTFLPGTQIDYPVLLPEHALAPGDYTATVRLSYAASVLGYRRSPGPRQHVTRSFSFTVTPAERSLLFRGVQPLRLASGKVATEGTPVLLWLAAGLAALLLVLAAATAALVRRRRP